jgi:hypothetical protein
VNGSPEFLAQCRAFIALDAAATDRAELFRDLQAFGADMAIVRDIAAAVDQARAQEAAK